MNHRLARLLSLTLLTFATVAQEPTEPPPPAAAVRARADAREISISISFPGGTLAELLTRVRALDANVNILAPELAADILLPPIELKQAAVSDALIAVARIVGEPYRVKLDWNRGPVGNLVYALEIQVRQAPAAAPTVRVFSLASITKTPPFDPRALPAMSAQTVLSALEAGARVQGQPIDLRFHEESDLLFVRGSEAQIELVMQVLSSLQKDQERLRKTPRAEPAPADPSAVPPAPKNAGK